jgi:hypothetical protein
MDSVTGGSFQERCEGNETPEYRLLGR